MESRTKFVVFWLVVLEIFAWLFSLGGNFYIHFWDSKYALDKLESAPQPDVFGNSTVMTEVSTSYHHPPRHMWFLPHILGAVFWWNLYFIQLIPSIRRKYPTAHRWLGRLLLLAALAQTVSGVGLACTSPSPIIRMVSIVLAITVLYVLGNAWYYARQRDFPRHKYWAYRLVGYLQTIAAQRLWFVILIAMHASGVHVLHPAFDETDPVSIDRTVLDMFDGSFVLAILSATYVTEWYLSGNIVGMLDLPERNGYRPLMKSSAAKKES